MQLRCWYIVVALVTWQVSGQAPGDANPECSRDMNAVFHQFPSDWVVLMDTFDYRNIFSGNGPWESVDFDNGGSSNGWSELGGVCTISLNACAFASGQPQENWLFSQYISYQFANEIIFQISFRFSRCQQQSACSNDYVTLHRYETNGPVGDRTVRSNYAPLFGSVVESRLQQPPQSDSSVSMNYSLVLPETRTGNGFYLGVEDDGTCGTVERIIVYFRVVRGREQDLLTCPDVGLPPQGSTASSRRDCQCHDNASPTSATLSRTCFINGSCSEEQACACSPGFTLSNGECTACPEGQFKAGISNDSCVMCPTNSENRGEGNAVCPCTPPNIQNPENPLDPCTPPPSSPRLLLSNAGVPQVEQSSITVCWLPSLDTGGLDDLRYNLYLFDATEEAPEFNKVNDEGVVQEEGDNQTVICYELQDINTDASYGIIVVAANGATGDPQVLQTDQVPSHSAVFFLSLVEGQDCSVFCPIGMYLVTTSNGSDVCISCPANSVSISADSRECLCIQGYYRNQLDDVHIGCTRPPSAARNFQVLEIRTRANTITVMWERPLIIGRDDYFYNIQYSNPDIRGSFVQHNANPLITISPVVRYSLSGLRPQTQYTIRLSVLNGVSDQDSVGEEGRRSEVMATTGDINPQAPRSVTSFCAVVVWRAPFRAYGPIVGYDVMFVDGEDSIMIMKDRDELFHTVQQGNLPNGGGNMVVQVRAKTDFVDGVWSEAIPLNCTSSTPPTCPP